MRRGAIVPIFLYLCHPRPVNGHLPKATNPGDAVLSPTSEVVSGSLPPCGGGGRGGGPRSLPPTPALPHKGGGGKTAQHRRARESDPVEPPGRVAEPLHALDAEPAEHAEEHVRHGDRPGLGVP